MGTIKPRSVPPKKLSQSIVSTDLSLKLNNILDWDGATNLVAGDFGTQLFAVLMNATKTVIEIIELNPATIASASITVLKRGLAFDGTQVEAVARKYDWPANETTVQLGSDVPQLLENFVDKARAQTIDGVKTFSSFPVKSGSTTPTVAAELATKAYVDLTATGNAVTDEILVSGLAGETLLIGASVYFKEADQRWWNTDADVPGTVDEVKIGIVQSSAVAGGAINVLVTGTDKNQTGLTPGSKYYLGNTPGAIATTPGTTSRFIGWAKNATELILSYDIDFLRLTQNEKDALVGTFGTPGSANRYITETDPNVFDGFSTGADGSYTLNGSQAAVPGLFSVLGSVFTLLRDNQFNILTIDSGFILEANGYAIHAKRVTGAGTIRDNGNNGGAGSGTTGGAAATARASGSLASNTAGKAGPNGGSGGASNGAPGVAGTNVSPSLVGNGAAGGTGGTTGTGPNYIGGTGGAAGVGTLESAFGARQFHAALVDAAEIIGTFKLWARGSVSGTLMSPAAGSGSGGGGAWALVVGGPSGGGGGGSAASGGILLIAALIIDGTLAMQANGGIGGVGGAGGGSYGSGGGGGGGGSGGVISLLYKTLGGSVTTSVAGGVGGAGGAGSGGGPGASGGTGVAGKVFKIKFS